MLRFFRRYHKHILISGAALLMVAFLIGPVLEQWRPDPGVDRLGRLGDRVLTIRDQRQVEVQLSFLANLERAIERREREDEAGPMFRQRLLSDLVRLTGRFDLQGAPLAYLLMIEEARRLGFEPSMGQTQRYLNAIGFDEQDLAAVGAQARITAAQGQSIIAQALAVRDYITAVTARDPQQAALDPYQLEPLDLHDPLVQRLLGDLFTTVSIRGVPVSVQRYYEQVEDQITDERVRALYQEHRDHLPGPDRPYGLGYRHPDRVRLEYVEVPFQDILRQVSITSAEAFAFFEEQPLERFVTEREKQELFEGIDPEHPDVARLRYQRIRDRVREQLRLTRARDIASSMIAWMRNELREPEVRLGLHQMVGDGQMAPIPDHFEPVAMDEVALGAQQAFKDEDGIDVLPRVRRLDRDWLDREALEGLDRISEAYVSIYADLGAAFPDYALHLYELGGAMPGDADVEDAPAAAEPRRRDLIERGLETLGLRAGVVSQSLRDEQDNRFLFRVLDVQPSHSPEFETIEQRVRRDALRIAAFQRLMAETETWRERGTGGLQRLASELDRSVVSPRPFPRREMAFDERIYFIRDEGVGDDEPMRRQVATERRYLRAPRVSETIAADATFVDHIFREAERIHRAGGLGTVSRARRTLAVPHPTQAELWVVRIEQFQAPHDPWQQFVEQTQWQIIQEFYQRGQFDIDPQMIPALAQQRAVQELMGLYGIAAGTDFTHYFTDEALAARVGFERHRRDEPGG